MDHRPLRVGKLIREELGRLILKELEFPGALVTITDVLIDKKLVGAKAQVSVIPASAAADALEKLGKAAGRLQYLVAKKINIRPMPKIHFEIDHGLENAAKVEKLLIEDNNK